MRERGNALNALRAIAAPLPVRDVNRYGLLSI
jgi:hypothetical protein